MAEILVLSSRVSRVDAHVQAIHCVTVPTRHMLCFYVPVAIFTIYLDHSNLGFFTSLPPGPLTGRLDPAAPAAPPLAILSSSDRMSLKIAKSQPFFSAISSISWTDMAIAQEIYLIQFAGGERLKRGWHSVFKVTDTCSKSKQSQTKTNQQQRPIMASDNKQQYYSQAKASGSTWSTSGQSRPPTGRTLHIRQARYVQALATVFAGNCRHSVVWRESLA